MNSNSETKLFRPETAVFRYWQHFGPICVRDNFVDIILNKSCLFSIFGIVCSVRALNCTTS